MVSPPGPRTALHRYVVGDRRKPEDDGGNHPHHERKTPRLPSEISRTASARSVSIQVAQEREHARPISGDVDPLQLEAVVDR